MQKFSAFKGLYVDRPKTNAVTTNTNQPNQDNEKVNHDNIINDNPTVQANQIEEISQNSKQNLSHKAKDYLKILAAHDEIVSHVLTDDRPH